MTLPLITAMIVVVLIAAAAIAAVVRQDRSRRLLSPRPPRLGARASVSSASIPVPGRGGLSTLPAAAPVMPAASGHDQHRVALEREDPILTRITITPEEYGSTRRTFLNRSILGLFGGAFLANLSAAFVAFLWPKLGSGFGSRINAGNLAEIRERVVRSDGSISPVFVPSAQAYVVPFVADIEQSQFGSATGAQLVVGAGGGEHGLMALWQRCVHLGCRVPQCLPSQGFECPCHGSKYNFHGEYEDGPAPRNLDRFAVEIDAAGNLIVDTGTIVETARAKRTTIAYPQGPSCI